jgi:hypothetical protein
MQTRRGREREEAEGRKLAVERAWDLFDARTRAEADRRTKRQLFDQLSAHHILKLARTLGVTAPKDIDARERFSYADAVRKELGI